MLLRSVFRTSLLAMLFALFAFSAEAAHAANHYVDDDGEECPAAPFSSIQRAIDAAKTGDTVVICPGDYAEGPGTPGTNGLTITRSLNLKGAGADQVTIRPSVNSANGGQIAAASPVLRDGVGNIITVSGAPSYPITVNISGVTVSGGGEETHFAGTSIWDGEFEHGVYSEAGIVFLDAGGSVSASRITNVFTSGRPGAFNQPGGYRSNDLGYGIAQVTAATEPPLGATARQLNITGTRVDRYNRGGVLIDGATGDTPPLTPSGVSNDGRIVGSQIVGRNLNSPPNDGTGGAPLLTTGPLFGQDGVRATAGATVNVDSSNLSQNYMAGAGADASAEWPGAAGLRLLGAGASSVTHSNVVSNSYGAVNVDLDGSSPDTGSPLVATDDFWGYPSTPNTTNTGPDVSPATIPNLPPTNPVAGTPTNPVNGAPDATFGSDAVHFVPFRGGSMADTDGGYWPIQDAPVPVPDAAPAVSLTATPASAAPGDKVTLTADATDDFGVSSITFYDGTDEIATVIPPDDSVTWTAPEMCGQRELSVVAADAIGQTATDSVEVTVTDCPVPPVPPTVSLSSPPSTIPQGGAVIAAKVDAPEGVGTVELMLGNRLVCTLKAAPFRCFVLPSGADVGSQSLRVVVTDAKGQTAEDSAATRVAKFKPRGLTVKAKRTGKRKVMVKVNGKLQRPARVTAGQACSDGRVTVVASQGKRNLINRQVKLKSNCTYKTGFKAKRARKAKRRKKAPPIRIRVRFPGNDVLTATVGKKRIR